jgi:hypothetical protein
LYFLNFCSLLQGNGSDRQRSKNQPVKNRKILENFNLADREFLVAGFLGGIIPQPDYRSLIAFGLAGLTARLLTAKTFSPRMQVTCVQHPSVSVGDCILPGADGLLFLDAPS